MFPISRLPIRHLLVRIEVNSNAIYYKSCLLYAFKHNPHMYAIYRSLLDIFEHAIYEACAILNYDVANNVHLNVHSHIRWPLLTDPARPYGAATQHLSSKHMLT